VGKAAQTMDITEEPCEGNKGNKADGQQQKPNLQDALGGLLGKKKKPQQ